MIRIGDFSKLGRISVKCLRHYDDLGLLKPAYVAAETGYRYYKADQLSILERLLSLKELGFSLEEIGILLHANLNPDQLLSLLEKRRKETQRVIRQNQDRLRLIDAFEQEIQRRIEMTPYEVTVRPVPAVLAASIKGFAPDPSSLGVTFSALFDEVFKYVDQHGSPYAGPGFDLIYDWPETNIPVEAVVPISKTIPNGDRVQITTIPAVENMACAIHRGSFEGLGQAFDALGKWIEENDYRICGAQREVYLECERSGDPAKYVTEIQMPVEKAS